MPPPSCACSCVPRRRRTRRDGARPQLRGLLVLNARVMSRLRLLLILAVGAGLAVPAAASATLTDIGKPADVPDSPPSCPASPCLAVSRTIGYQVKVGATRSLMTVPADGRLVSWSVTLGAPGAEQTQFFNDKLGGEPQAQIAVLRTGRRLRA